MCLFHPFQTGGCYPRDIPVFNSTISKAYLLSYGGNYFRLLGRSASKRVTLEHKVQSKFNFYTYTELLIYILYLNSGAVRRFHFLIPYT